MTVSPSKIYCPSELQQKRPPTVSDGLYILVGDAIMARFLLIRLLCDVLIDSGRSFLLKVRWKIYFCWWDYYECVLLIIMRSQYNNQQNHCNDQLKYNVDVTLCRKERPLSYQNVTQHNNQQNTVIIVSPTQIYCPSDQLSWLCFCYYYTEWRSDRQWTFFST
jgi:hypothetical protein